nr:MAG TPA: hypothetical protein [Bacteriophage sp.]
MKLESLVSWLVFVGTAGSSVFLAYSVIYIVDPLDVNTSSSPPPASFTPLLFN